ncbi:hypothetical protein ABES02_02155 [Neobacillus pocheonensis]|uniref:hypothetical protein n=1 Tax=Neobacillus pocheonensis TaxID=363869 RepID=UPI003D2B9F09
MSIIQETIWLYNLWLFNFFFVIFGVREVMSWEKRNNKIKKYIYLILKPNQPGVVVGATSAMREAGLVVIWQNRYKS